MASSIFSSFKVIALITIAWIIWALLHAFALFVFGVSVEIALIDAAANNFLLLLSSLIVSNTLRYYQPRKRKYLNIIAWCGLLAGLSVFLFRVFVMQLLGQHSNYLAIVDNSIVIRLCIGFLMVSGMGLASMLWYSQREQKENERRKADAERLAKEAELYNLRQQLQPHFLFNSLNSISALVGRRPDEARTMIYQLSDFLRGTLRKEENEFVSLDEELQHLQLYLDIEKVRFGHRLKTEISKEEGCGTLILPAMLLQPIVENAIKFGLYDTTGEVTISIKAKCIQHYLAIKVQNPYDPSTVRPNSGTGFGLSGIKRRLYLLFARTDLLETLGENNTFTTVVKIPQV